MMDLLLSLPEVSSFVKKNNTIKPLSLIITEIETSKISGPLFKELVAQQSSVTCAVFCKSKSYCSSQSLFDFPKQQALPTMKEQASISSDFVIEAIDESFTYENFEPSQIHSSILPLSKQFLLEFYAFPAASQLLAHSITTRMKQDLIDVMTADCRSDRLIEKDPRKVIDQWIA